MSRLTIAAAAILACCNPARADYTLSFSGTTSGPVSTYATFHFSAGMLTVTLNNSGTVNPGDVAQNVSRF